jgi:hypothetical protein
LRYLSEAGLRDQVAKATNKTEAFNAFSTWLAFGSNGLLTSRDPELVCRLMWVLVHGVRHVAWLPVGFISRRPR